MKRLWALVVGSFYAVLFFSGLSFAHHTPNYSATKTDSITKNTPLYLEPSAVISNPADTMQSWHYSHASHESHASHYSHYSSR